MSASAGDDAGWKSGIITGFLLLAGFTILGVGAGFVTGSPQGGVLMGFGAGLVAGGLVHWDRSRRAQAS